MKERQSNSRNRKLTVKEMLKIGQTKNSFKNVKINTLKRVTSHSN